jgi:ADP-dependent NAD(P)H-hydrate dehydratase / NAD(P)H-hydrate epimerase
MSIPVLSIAEMRAWENKSWAANVAADRVIARVGQLVAERAQALTRPGDSILVLTGKGHNGDDARAAGMQIKDRRVQRIDFRDFGAGVMEFRSLRGRPALVIDGLFGIGLNRELDAEWRAVIDELNGMHLPVLAVDVPSGLDADTGEPFGAAVRATATLTLAAPKIGLLKEQGAPWVGHLDVAPDIGLLPMNDGLSVTEDTDEADQRPAAVAAWGTEVMVETVSRNASYRLEAARDRQFWVRSGDFAGFPPDRTVSAHKGTFGHLAVIAGSRGYHGAAVLAASGALRARPGLVSVLTPESVYSPVASQLQSAMVHAWEDVKGLPESTTAVLAGPGLASDSRPADLVEQVRMLWDSSSLPMLADASALDFLPEAKPRTESVRVITPHPGEAARLLGCSVQDVQGDRPGALRRLSGRFGGCWVVLKGHRTLVGRHEGPILVNSSGNPGLAQGGSGDLLAGFIGGLLAQPLLQTDVSKLLSFAVWEHGNAADRLHHRSANWIIRDLSDEMGRIVVST